MVALSLDLALSVFGQPKKYKQAVTNQPAMRNGRRRGLSFNTGHRTDSSHIQRPKWLSSGDIRRSRRCNQPSKTRTQPACMFISLASVPHFLICISSQRLGANISTSVSLAQLILVDSSTKPGRQFIRDWGQDNNKAVLEFGWARKSIEAGRALLQADNWGGCKAIDDGTPSDDDDVDSTEGQRTKKPVRSKSVHHIPSCRASSLIILFKKSIANTETNTNRSSIFVASPWPKCPGVFSVSR
jgi:hypothetical protein